MLSDKHKAIIDDHLKHHKSGYVDLSIKNAVTKAIIELAKDLGKGKLSEQFKVSPNEKA